MTRVYAISDMHFGHQNIIKYCNREHPTAMEDAGAMISAWNSAVCDHDYVIMVGDISASKQGRVWLPKIIPRLKGRKILVRGNHDLLTDIQYMEMQIEKVVDILMLVDPKESKTYVFCHYPDQPRAVALAQDRDAYLVCGHTHKQFPGHNYWDDVQRINVAVDVMGKTPRLLFEI